MHEHYMKTGDPRCSGRISSGTALVTNPCPMFLCIHYIILSLTRSNRFRKHNQEWLDVITYSIYECFICSQVLISSIMCIIWGNVSRVFIFETNNPARKVTCMTSINHIKNVLILHLWNYTMYRLKINLAQMFLVLSSTGIGILVLAEVPHSPDIFECSTVWNILTVFISKTIEFYTNVL